MWFKMGMKAGDRGTGSAYNESSGTLRIDNLHLIGSAPTSNTSFVVNKLHYFLFHVDRPEITKQGIIQDAENPSLELELPTGDYKVFFVWNSSEEELILPNTASSANELYTVTIFSNRHAEIYGYMGDLEVNSNMTSNIVLQRLYSQVKIEFTDAWDL